MNSSKPAFIATVLVAMLAVAAAVFAFWNIARGTDDAGVDGRNGLYRPSPSLEDEMYEAAQRLINNNIIITELFIWQGLPVIKEPYANTADRPLGNPPEDGYFYVDGNINVRDKYYRTYTDVESIVRETFIAEEAERVLENRVDNKSYYSDYGRIYTEKRANPDGFTLGVTENFALDLHPYPTRNPYFQINWSDADMRFALTPISDFECLLKIELTVDGSEHVFERSITDLDGYGWRLSRLIYKYE
ncbi:MAG: hypothetical protein FWG70_08825 [Oscillospiraceae bacterium]|nr:hypothetical protein [Oscillospiraceae bacterium]